MNRAWLIWGVPGVAVLALTAWGRRRRLAGLVRAVGALVGLPLAMYAAYQYVLMWLYSLFTSS